MSPLDLLTKLRVQPFEPFRIVTSDGTTYEIRHPDLVSLTFSSAMVGFPDPQHPGILARYDIVSMRHIIRLEQVLPVGSTAAPQSN